MITTSLAQSLNMARQVCIASIAIKDNGFVGFAYREKPNFENDSGWRFFSGSEDETFNNNSEHFVLFQLNEFKKLYPEINQLINNTTYAAWIWHEESEQYQPFEEWQSPEAE